MIEHHEFIRDPADRYPDACTRCGRTPLHYVHQFPIESEPAMSYYDPEMEVGSRLEGLLIEVGSERKRQLALKAAGRFTYTMSDDEMTDFERVTCIMEEVGEVARNALARAGMVTDGEIDDKALRKELCQVAALA